MRRCMSLVVLVLASAALSATAAGAAEESRPSDSAELVYENCYEQVGGFRVPTPVLDALVGSALPHGFVYRTFDPAETIGQFNVVGLDCDQGGHRVTDLLINVVVIVPSEFSDGRPTLLRARTYTNSPQTLARYGLYCFGNVTTLADVTASADTDPSAGVRHGRVTIADGTRSIDLTTTAPPPARPDPAATLQHFTLKGGAVHGRIEWGNADPGLRQGAGTGTATLVLDDDVTSSGNEVTYTGGGQHIFAADGDPFNFFHRGLTRCPPGLDWIE